MRLIDWLSRDVVAIVDDDGDSCQSHKLIQRLLALGELRVLEKIRPQPLGSGLIISNDVKKG